MKLLKTVRRLRRIITIPPGGPRLNSPLKKGTVPLGSADRPQENQSSERDSPLFQQAAMRRDRRHCQALRFRPTS